MDQFAALVSALPDIEAELSAAGISIPRPNYDKTTTTQKDGEAGEQERSNTDEEPEGTKKNFEATSDEDED